VDGAACHIGSELPSKSRSSVNTGHYFRLNWKHALVFLSFHDTVFGRVPASGMVPPPAFKSRRIFDRCPNTLGLSDRPNAADMSDSSNLTVRAYPSFVGSWWYCTPCVYTILLFPTLTHHRFVFRRICTQAISAISTGSMAPLSLQGIYA
jgi:hypothetical protein